MTFGPREDDITRALKERGMKVPETITESPELPTSLLFYWNAFWELHSCRTNSGYGPGPLPWVAMSEYGRRYLIEDPEDFECFSDLMFAMDKEFFQIRSELKDTADG